MLRSETKISTNYVHDNFVDFQAFTLKSFLLFSAVKSFLCVFVVFNFLVNSFSLETVYKNIHLRAVYV